jgi:glycerol-1-phosphate dehydrogenase [NAD(P)+]
MSVIFRKIEVPVFIKIENNCLYKIKDILKEQKSNFVDPLYVVSSRIAKLNLFPRESTYIPQDNSIIEAEKIISDIKNHDVVISVGGGKILDLGKYAATKAELNYISVPTSPSNDGIASPIAVLKNEQGITESLGVNMPMGILVDMDLMKEAPLDNIRAGIGDLISNYSALQDWQLAHKDKKENIDDFAASLAYSAADLIYSQQQGKEKINIQDEKFLKTLINGLILSGVAMNIAGSSRPCSGAEHEISHAIDKLFPYTAAHGSQVAVAMIIVEKMRQKDCTGLINFYQNIGLPTSYKDLNLTKEQMIEAVLYAPQTRPDRYTILEKLNLSREQIEKYI